jgi:ABC-type polysaccharide/polyol phosphate export permease
MNSETKSDTLGLIWSLLASLLIWAAVAVMTSCTLRINADGSKDATIDAPAALRVLEIIAEK